jgi:ATP-dependent Lhr-like helicase
MAGSADRRATQRSRSQGPKRTSIWQRHSSAAAGDHSQPHLDADLRQRRRVAERLAGALNDLAGEPIARAHHGSLAASQRTEIEELLKAGKIKALVATSSLELGIDMGAIDLVIQIEAPPSVASGMQRIGRAGHQVGAPSNGIIFPKYRADLVACAAVTRAMHEGHVESTRFLRNPLDVLAQQMVATIAHPPLSIVSEAERKRKRGGLRTRMRHLLDAALPRSCAAPRRSRAQPLVFEGVLDMLAGRYPSDEFAELRPRITWDRVATGSRRGRARSSIAILNGGTIPDRGLYGVFLAGARASRSASASSTKRWSSRARTGDTFILGASTWRIEEITHDRVLVSPAPGDPGKMPFWHGDRAGRPSSSAAASARWSANFARCRNAAISAHSRRPRSRPARRGKLMRYLADQEISHRHCAR